MIELRIYVEDLEELYPQWTELLDRVSDHTIYQTPEWHRTWLAAFGEAHSLCVLAAYLEDRLVGIAPLSIYQQKINFINESVLGFIGGSNFASDYCDFVIDDEQPKVLESFLVWIQDNSDQWTVLDLINLREDSCNLGPVIESLNPIVKEPYDAPACCFEEEGWPEAVTEKESVKRHYNRLNREGEVQFDSTLSVDDTLATLDSFFDQHRQRWDGTDTPSLFYSPAQEEFYRGLTKALEEKGWLRFSRLSLDGDVVAYHFGFQYRGRYIWYKPTYNKDYEHLSVGQVLIRSLILEAKRGGASYFDFTCGSEPFKYRFSNDIVKMKRLLVYRRFRSRLLSRLRELLKLLFS